MRNLLKFISNNLLSHTNTERCGGFILKGETVYSEGTHAYTVYTSWSGFCPFAVVLMGQTLFVYLMSKFYEQTAREGQNALK